MATSIFDYNDYRAFLRASLEEKTRKNPSFSLRAFARSAGVSPSHLSRSLRGQKTLSVSSGRMIALGLGLTSREASRLQSLIELERATKRDVDPKLLAKIAAQTGASKNRSKLVSLEVFQLISHWYHFAILNLAGTRGFQSSATWIAQRLGLRSLEAKIAVERLLELGLLEDRGGKWTAANGGQLSTTDGVKSAAIRENHRQHLEKAAVALEEIPIELREFHNLSLVMNLKDLGKAKQAIRDFVEEFNREQERENGEEVFQLNIQFYPLTKIQKGRA